MSRRKVGIPGWMVGENSFGITVAYGKYIQSFLNGEIHILSPEMAIREDLDMILLPGGSDVNPVRYGQWPDFSVGNPNIFLEAFDTYYLPQYIEMNTPIFGICRGMQTLAVHFECELFQDMDHETNDKYDKGKTVHSIIDNHLQKYKVNSRHHQSVMMTELGKKNLVTVEATHSSFKTHIEAIRIQNKPIFAVQFHPEDMLDSSIDRWILDKLKRYDIIK